MKKRLNYLLLCVVLLLAGELYMLISLPAQSSASTNPPNSDTCGNYLTVTTTETACTANYRGVYTIASKGQAFDISYTSQGYYCPNPHPTEGSQAGRPACLENGHVVSGSAHIGAGGSTSIAVAAPIQNSCGSAQTDLSFDVYQHGYKVCSYGNPNFVWGWSYCTTNASCYHPTPTPTSTPTPTTMPTPTSTSTPTPTNAPTPTSTPTPTTQPTPTVTVPVTPTPTTPPPTPISTNTGCGGTQIGVNNNMNCQSQQQGQQQGQSQSQNNNQTIENNANNSNNITISLANAVPVSQQQQQQQVLAATVAPAPTTSQLPSTGAGLQVLAGLLSLLPIGIKLKKLS